MGKNIITQVSYIMLMITLVLGGMFTFASEAEYHSNIWLSIILAFLFYIPFYIIIYCLLKKEGNKNFFRVISEHFSFTFAKIIFTLYFLYAIFVCASNINSVSNYIKYNDLIDTPKIIISSFFLFLAFYVLDYGFYTLSNFNKFMFLIILLSLFIPIFFSYDAFNFQNLLPIINTSLEDIVHLAFLVLTTLFGELIFLFFSFPPIFNSNLEFKTFVKGISYSFIILSIVYTKNVLVLGQNLMTVIKYPNYYSTALIGTGEFFQRFEIFTSIILIVTGFIKISVCLFFIMCCIEYLFNLRSSKKSIISVLIIEAFLSYVLFNGVTRSNFIASIYPYISIVMQFILPLVLVVIISFKRKKFLKAKI